MKKQMTLAVSAMLLLGTFAYAKAAKSPVTVTTASYQLVVKKVKDKKGKIKKVKKWVKATKVIPGTIVRYIDTIHNNSADPLSTVAIKNPINEHLTYVAGSAKAESNATITYSVDGGNIGEVFVDRVFDRNRAEGIGTAVVDRIDIADDRPGDDLGRLDPLFDLFDLALFTLDFLDHQLIRSGRNRHGALGLLGVGECPQQEHSRYGQCHLFFHWVPFCIV